MVSRRRAVRRYAPVAYAWKALNEGELSVMDFSSGIRLLAVTHFEAVGYLLQNPRKPP